MEFRRFNLKFNDEAKIQVMKNLILNKGLTRDDILIILASIELNPDIDLTEEIESAFQKCLTTL